MQSEVSLHHPTDARHFVNTDETHQKFSNESDAGGPRARRYACSFISCCGDRVISNGRHTTGCYSSNAYDEALPPLFILDSKAKFEENYKIDPRVCIGLPEVVGKYGLHDDYFRDLRRKIGLSVNKDVAFSSCISVCRKGGMTTASGCG